MAATERFVELVAGEELPLDEVALLIAAHDHPVDIAGELSQLDDLAAGAPDDAAALSRYLFMELGYAGDSVHYYDPRNSYLDEVRRRRVGLPITLSTLMLEVGRRRGIVLQGIALPGHFLVGAGSGVFYDPFHGGTQLDEADCRRRFAPRHWSAGPFPPAFLQPATNRQIVARMLANLVGIFLPHDPVRATWVLRLRLAIPVLAPGERCDIAMTLGNLGHYAEAARAIEAMLPELDKAQLEPARQALAGFRAHDN